MDIPDYYVSDEEFDEMPIIDKNVAYDAKADGKRFLFGNGTQWGTHRNGCVGVLHKDSERNQFAPSTKPLAKTLTRNQAKAQRRKRRRK